MADKPAEKKPEAAPAAAAEKKEAPAKKGGLLTQTPVLLGGVMIVEAVVLFGGFKFLMGGQPKTAAGADLVQPTTNPTDGGASVADPKKLVEVQLVDFKALNKLSGHSFLYDVSIFVTTKSENEDQVTNAIKDNSALIEDRVRTIIAELDPEKLGGGAEPGLETLRRQVKFQLDQILGDGMVDEVLVPRCIPFRTDY